MNKLGYVYFLLGDKLNEVKIGWSSYRREKFDKGTRDGSIKNKRYIVNYFGPDLTSAAFRSQ